MARGAEYRPGWFLVNRVRVKDPRILAALGKAKRRARIAAKAIRG